ncbi:MAG TPA: response regulator [Caulobacteraceae bacterium]
MSGAPFKAQPRLKLLMQRVLIVDPSAAPARALSDLLRQIAPCQVWTAPSAGIGFELAGRIDPHLVLADQATDGAGFTRALRAGDLNCRQAAVIMLCAEITAGGLIAARDAGANEILARPCTLESLLGRIEAVLLRDRDWIEAVSYIGPDRRQFNAGELGAGAKRRRDGSLSADAARIQQALHILAASARLLHSEPRQAMRSMLAQTAILKSAEPSLAARATAFEEWLATAELAAVRRLEIDSQVRRLTEPSARDGTSAAA